MYDLCQLIHISQVRKEKKGNVRINIMALKLRANPNAQSNSPSKLIRNKIPQKTTDSEDLTPNLDLSTLQPVFFRGTHIFPNEVKL